MKKPNQTSRIIGALLLGAAIGGGLGILFAPGKGSKTRKKILGKSDELSDAIKAKYNALFSQMEKEVAAEASK